MKRHAIRGALALAFAFVALVAPLPLSAQTSQITTNARSVWRDFTIDGAPSSGAWNPKKGDIRNWGALVGSSISALQNAQLTGVIAFGTLVDLNSTLAYGPNTAATVFADPTSTNNGVYQKVGASGSGYWSRISPLVYGLQPSVAVGTVTAGACNTTPLVSVSGPTTSPLLNFTLPTCNYSGSAPISPATVSTLGGIKVGSGLAVAGDGTLSATASGAADETLLFDEMSGVVGNGVAFDNAAINSDLFSRYGGLSTGQPTIIREIHATTGKTYRLNGPINVRQQFLHFHGHGANLVCDGSDYAFDVGQDGTGNPNLYGLIEGFHISGCTGSGIRGRAASQWKIINNRIVNNAIGIDWHGVANTISDNFLRYNSSHGILVPAAITVGGVTPNESQRDVISNNIIYDSGWDAIRIVQGVGHLIEKNDLENNSQNCTPSTPNPCAEIHIMSSTGNTLLANYFEPYLGPIISPATTPTAVEEAIRISNDLPAGTPVISGRNAAGNQIIGGLIGGGATNVIDIAAGNENVMMAVRTSGNILVQASAAYTFIGRMAGAPAVYNNSTTSWDWSNPAKLTGVASISGTAKQIANPSGFFDWASGDTSKSIVFGTAEVDGAYDVQIVECWLLSGTLPTGACDIHTSVKSASGFTLRTPVAPTTGTMRTKWRLVRTP
jgi:hypothetical protein